MPEHSLAHCQVHLDKSRNGTVSLRRYVALQWPSLILTTMRSGLDHIREIIGTLDRSEVPGVLAVHFRHLVATVQRFWEFSILYKHFPWRCELILDSGPDVVARTLKEMESEWKFLLRMEERFEDASRAFPLKDIPHVRWHCYREIMTVCEENKFSATDEVRSLISSWQADPCSSLGCEDSFRVLRTAERKHAGGEVAPLQLQALSIKALSERYTDHEHVDIDPSCVHSVPVSTVLKPAVFSAKRSTASETNLSTFGHMLKETIPSAHHLTRRCLNLWSACKARNGDLSGSWVPELIRPGQVPCLLNYKCMSPAAFARVHTVGHSC